MNTMSYVRFCKRAHAMTRKDAPLPPPMAPSGSFCAVCSLHAGWANIASDITTAQKSLCTYLSGGVSHSLQLMHLCRYSIAPPTFYYQVAANITNGSTSIVWSESVTKLTVRRWEPCVYSSECYTQCFDRELFLDYSSRPAKL